MNGYKPHKRPKEIFNAKFYGIMFLLIVVLAAAGGLLKDGPQLEAKAASTAEPSPPSSSSIQIDSGVVETAVPVIAGIPPAPTPAPEPQPITAADWYGVAPADLQDRLKGLYIPTVAEVDKTTKMMPGEYNGSSITERTQPVWCALNRIDSNDSDFKNIKTLTQAINHGAFHGYYSSNPVLPEYKELAIDVITRWLNEKLEFEDVGRVLPEEFLFFSGTGKHNIYRTMWPSRDPNCKFYDGSLPSPYES